MGPIKAETLHVSAERADGNPPVVQEWHIQESDRGRRQRRIVNANPFPVEGQKYDRQKLHCYSQSKSDGRSRTPSAHERRERHQEQERANDVDVTASRHPHCNNGFQANASTRWAGLLLSRRTSRSTNTMASSQTTNATFSAKADS